MRWIMTLAVAVAMTALLVGDAAAQPQPGRGQGGRQGGGMGGGGSPLMLLANADVQTELKLTDEQKEKAKAAGDKMREKMREAFQGAGAGNPPDREKMQAMMKEMNDEATKTVNEILNEDQQKRLKQLGYQAMGAGAFNNADVQKAISVTDEQKDKLKSINDDMQKEMRELRQGGGGGNNPDTQKKIDALRKETSDKVMAVLTDDQKSKWKELTGEPVKFSLAPAGGGRRPGGPGGAGGARPPAGNPPPPPPPPPV